MITPELNDLNEKWIVRLRQAAENYLKYYGKEWIGHHKPLNELTEYFGDPYEPGARGLIVDITKPEIQKKVEMLASPHWYAIMKAWEANRNDATD